MKQLLSAFLLLFAFTTNAQLQVNRASPANTVVDARLGAAKNLYLPRYNDTTQANLDLGLDSCGSVFYQRVTNLLWKRSCNPKRWELVADTLYIVKTKSQMDALLTAGSLVKGATYKITGVHPTLYDDGTSSGTTIFLQALENNKLSSAGVGEFYNPKYTTAGSLYGIWAYYSTAATAIVSGVLKPGETITADNGAVGVLLSGFSNNKIFFTVTSGNWSAATSITGGTSGATATISSVAVRAYTTGAKVNWGGYVWSNVNGNVGAATTPLALNSEWTKVAYNTTDYNIALDAIVYDYTNNVIVKRTDIFNNVVSYDFSDIAYFASKSLVGNPISVFQWGAIKTHGNNISGSYYENVNSLGNHDQNNLYRQSIFGNNFMTTDAFISGNNLFTRSEMRNNSLIEVAYFYNNNLYSVSTMNGNVIYNSATMYANFLESGSAINSNQVRTAEFYENQVRYASTITGNISNQKWGYVTKNNMVASSINSNTLNGLYVTAVGSDQAFINNNTMNYGRIDANVFNVVFNGRRLYICNNTLLGDNNNDIPIRYSMISGSTITSLPGINGTGSNTYIRLNYLKIAHLLNANIGSEFVSIQDNVIDDYVWDFQSVASNGRIKGAKVSATQIDAMFSVTFTGTGGAGAIGAVSIPPYQAPAGYFISEVTLDAGTGLTGTGAVINLGIATDGASSGINDTQGQVSGMNTTPVQRFPVTTFVKSTGTRALVMEVKTAPITAGTLAVKIRMEKLQ